MLLRLLAGPEFCRDLLGELKRRMPGSLGAERRGMLSSLLSDTAELTRALAAGGSDPRQLVGHMKSTAAQLRGHRWTPVPSPRLGLVGMAVVSNRLEAKLVWLIFEALAKSDARGLEEALDRLSELLSTRKENKNGRELGRRRG